MQKLKNIAICDKCGKNTKINHKYKRVGELEYRYFRCKRCGEVYVISVTDEELRKEIKKYQKIMEETKVTKPEISQEAKMILEKNIKRSRELKEKHPLKLKPWE